jgi:uncharacterized membrane protein
MNVHAQIEHREQSAAARANRVVYQIARHWLLLLNVILGVYVGLPWLAPVLMQLGWTTAGQVIYWLYSTQCHQLPQRSYFLFGPQATYSLAEVQAAWQPTTNPLLLREFVGNAALGWKVAWSDRMVSMYTGLIPASLGVWTVRRWVKPLPGWGFVLFLVPMLLDGGTHLLSDFAGLGQGFRDSNAWLAGLTGHVFPQTFYAGDALGSFNSWLRLITGSLFAIGGVWFAYPYLEDAFAGLRQDLEAKFQRAGLTL